MLVEIWSDVVCPWCYIGKRRFEAALARFPRRDEVEVRWRSFELDPGAPQERTEPVVDRLAAKYGTTREQAQAMLDRMTATAETEGLRFRFDVARRGSTFDAHRLLHLAADRGRQPVLKERLMAAYFTEGLPIADVDTLVSLAGEAGLDRAEVQQTLAGEGYADAVRDDEAQARQLGITGVPFFVIDRAYGVSGAQPAEVLLEVLEQTSAREERQPNP